MSLITINIYFSLIHIIGPFLVLCVKSIEAVGTFEFNFHHKYSDSFHKILNIDGLTEKGTSNQYYASMLRHDHRRLASKVKSVPLTFAAGNMTVQIDELGYLHYAAVSIGTPSKTFLVALDTGSALAWIPCDCSSCPRTFVSKRGKKLDFNMYSPSASKTSSINCNSSKCISGECAADSDSCHYKIIYGDESSSSGILVEEMLHLVTNNDPQNTVHASITLGCGMYQTGGFLSGGGLNGLFGLGADSISLPSMLAKKNLTADSFSMCFGPNGVGRIVFGNKGSSSQAETPYFVHSLFPTYSITMTQVIVGEEVESLNFAAIVDSGTSFTYLKDPVYSTIVNSFNSQVQDSRYHNISEVLFEFCYNLRETPNAPELSFTATGGSRFNVITPIAIFSNQERNGNIYCLSIIKSENISIIGQNFMRGHQIIFNREREVLGWRKSDCSATSENGLNNHSPPPIHSSATPPSNNQLVQPSSAPIPHRSGSVYPFSDSPGVRDATSTGFKFTSCFSRKLLVIFLLLLFEQVCTSIYSLN